MSSDNHDTIEKKSSKKENTKKKKDKDEDQFASGRWTDEEEKLFLEALELYGRDWDKVLLTLEFS